MIDAAIWERTNADYLTAALDCIRARLSHAARSARKDQPTGEAGAAGIFRRRQGGPTRAVSSAELRRSAAALDAAEACDPPPALPLLARRFALSPFERNVLLLCAAVELDPGVAPLCGRAQGDPARSYPTFALAMNLFEGAAWDVLSPERPLRYFRLVEIQQTGNEPLTVCPLRIDERIVSFIKGLNYLDDRLAPLLVPFDIDEESPAELPRSQQEAADRVVRHLRQAWSQSVTPIIQLLGADTLSKQMVARNVAERSGLHLHRLPAELLPSVSGELTILARLWQRESALLPVALYLDLQSAADPLPIEGRERDLAVAVRRFLARTHGIFFLGTREIDSHLGLSAPAVEIGKPTSVEQQAAWEAGLDGAAANAPKLLAGQFNLNVAAIRQIARYAGAADSNGDRRLRETVWDACLAATRPRLDLLAERLEPKATWNEIVLPPEPERLLRQIAAQVGARGTVYDDWGFRAKMSRGLGISALFAGDSGTGKTMAAEVLANELRLNLYRIDLSAVVSKYIGETEKNLRRLFDAAEDGGAILFFDEADALFGKRSEVKDSHDRYANIEINYLLQRMEAYRGLAILATNQKSALDPAFVRRLRFIVNFPFPGVEERAAIWRKVFPAATPIADLDFERLARLNLAGGSIHNIALNAAFSAAEREQPVAMPLLLEAAKAEFRKMERPINQADFRWPGVQGEVA